MQREIKFRAWNGNHMYYNDSVNIGIGGQVCYLEPSGEWEQDEIGKIKLMQFTGMKDKFGKEIYEGDVLDFVFDSVIFVQNPYYVVFEDGAFLVHKPNFHPLVSDCSNIKIVGNIYENLELVH